MDVKGCGLRPGRVVMGRHPVLVGKHDSRDYPVGDGVLRRGVEGPRN